MKIKPDHTTRKKKEGFLNILFPLLTLICLAGFAGSLVFPNKVLDTYEINMKEEEGEPEVLLPLSYDEPIVYNVDTEGRPLYGIQPGIDKRGAFQSGRMLVTEVRLSDTVICRETYEIAAGDDLQYVYLPFSKPDKCKGDLSIYFTLEGGSKDEEPLPALRANFSDVKNASVSCPHDTKIVPAVTAADGTDENADDTGDTDADVADPNEDDMSGMIEEYLETDRLQLKGYHIYSHNTYPLLYDMRILTFVFLAVSMTVSFKKRRERK
ncbi:MAG: hypothetical protein J5842_08055 [Lachnospiraceae bacterium]|nr:hypothetical protein [Lachnospiraceae bacterium]